MRNTSQSFFFSTSGFLHLVSTHDWSSDPLCVDVSASDFMPRSSEGGMEEDEEGDGDVAGADALRGDLRVNAAARVRVEKSYKRQKDSVDAVRNF